MDLYDVITVVLIVVMIVVVVDDVLSVFVVTVVVVVADTAGAFESLQGSFFNFNGTESRELPPEDSMCKLRFFCGGQENNFARVIFLSIPPFFSPNLSAVI